MATQTDTTNVVPFRKPRAMRQVTRIAERPPAEALVLVMIAMMTERQRRKLQQALYSVVWSEGATSCRPPNDAYDLFNDAMSTVAAAQGRG